MYLGSATFIALGLFTPSLYFWSQGVRIAEAEERWVRGRERAAKAKKEEEEREKSGGMLERASQGKIIGLRQWLRGRRESERQDEDARLLAAGSNIGCVRSSCAGLDAASQAPCVFQSSLLPHAIVCKVSQDQATLGDE